jgi:hypothetical protein
MSENMSELETIIDRGRKFWGTDSLCWEHINQEYGSYALYLTQHLANLGYFVEIYPVNCKCTQHHIEHKKWGIL